MNRLSKPSPIITLILMLSLSGSADVTAAVVDSVLNDSESAPPKIVILGSGLASAVFRLAGIDISASCVNNASDTEQHIEYCPESAQAVPESGSYKLLVNGTTEFDIYFEHAVVTQAPPPPPPTSDGCACVTGISASGSGQWSQPPIPSDNFVFCLWNETGQPYTEQAWITGSFIYNSSSYTISALWDPNNPTYDPTNPGNSTSVCALHNETTDTFEVHHPVSSDQQFGACFDWMLRYGGPCM